MNLKSKYIIILLTAISLNLHAQKIDTSYFPKHNDEVSEAEYNRGLEALKNVYRQIKEDNNRVPYYIDYWNVASSYSIMQTEKQHVWEFLKKSKEANHKNFCVIVNFTIERKGLENMAIYKFLGSEFVNFISDCEGITNTPASIEEKLKRKESLDLTKLNESLIDKLIALSEKDQRYRHDAKIYNENIEAQTKLDKQVESEMILILEEYGYPGKDLVGEPFMNWSCMFIEHFLSLESLEKYLPMVVEAFHKGQLNKNYLTMLIDRKYKRKTGKQIFGSHMDTPFFPPQELKRIKTKYGLE